MSWLKVILLFPLGAVWWCVTFVRRMFYDYGIYQRYISPVETICIGNLKVGGTGKTPHVLAFVQEYADRNIAILSRGYGRKTKGLFVVDKSDASKYGDEPSMLKQRLPSVPIVVSESRVNGLQYIEENFPKVDLILMDDAFQHLAVKCSRYVLLTEFHLPYFRDWVLPMGWLRESRYFSKKADEVIVTKCPETVPTKTIDRYLNKIGKARPVRFSKMQYAECLYSLQGEELSWETLKEDKHLLVTGIANPKPLLDYLQKQAVEYAHKKFPDHHSFSSKDIVSLEQHLTQNPKAKLITTEKDAVRLSRVESLAKQLFIITIEVKYINH